MKHRMRDSDHGSDNVASVGTINRSYCAGMRTMRYAGTTSEVSDKRQLIMGGFVTCMRYMGIPKVFEKTDDGWDIRDLNMLRWHYAGKDNRRWWNPMSYKRYAGITPKDSDQKPCKWVGWGCFLDNAYVVSRRIPLTTSQQRPSIGKSSGACAKV